MINTIEYNFFKKNGYLVKKSPQIKDIKYIRDKILETIFKIKPTLKNKLEDKNLFFENLHKNISLKELNSVRVKIIKDMNKNKKIFSSYYNAATEILDFFVGNEILMQNQISLSIQMPNDTRSQLPMHSDIHAGESPFEVVIWIPLMNIAKSSHSMFITSPKHNKIIHKEVINTKKLSLDQIYKKHKKKFKFIEASFGDVVIFSPILLHGNIINKTNKTRSSLNCRFKSLLSPNDVFLKTHRNIPHFYKPLNIKPMTKIGFNYIEAMNEKKVKENN